MIRKKIEREKKKERRKKTSTSYIDRFGFLTQKLRAWEIILILYLIFCFFAFLLEIVKIKLFV